MDPVLFELGPFALQWYGIFIVGGAVIAAWLSSRYAERAGENPDHIWNLLAWTLVFGIIGARLYHVFSSPADGGGWAYYRENPSRPSISGMVVSVDWASTVVSLAAC